jgi:hypothetical protein
MIPARTARQRDRGFIFTTDALLGLITLLLLGSLLSSHLSTQAPQNDTYWKQAQVTLSSQSRYLAGNTTTLTASATQASYYCHKTAAYSPATAAVTPITYCEETR